MAANTPGSIRFAPKGRVFVAPIGTAAPTDVTTVFAPTWRELGYVSPDGCELIPSVDSQPVEVWQSATPVKYVVNSASCQLKFTLMQFDSDATALYFGSSWVAAEDAEGNPITGVFTLDLASTPDLAEKAIAVEWGDANSVSRLIIPRAMVSEREGLKLTRTNAQSLGVTMDALDTAGRLGYILTNASGISAAA
ncbi:phage tail tube protein [Nonomuraea zeae]|uniref:phage tail tube protein n=1 Tax=Nonomuraea zeae TaxID=1642303 RepID=UPI003617226C